MGIVNRRNAVLGWATWQAGKRVAKRKAKDALPGRSGGSSLPKAKTAAALAALGGAFWFWRRRDDTDE